MTDELLSEEKNGTLWVSFNRPQARNALTFAMYEGLAEICATAHEREGIRAIVVKGEGGKAFAAGTDMTQFRSFNKPQDALDYEARIEAVLTAIETCRLPTIAAIHGACTGGGASIAAVCDLRIVSDSLKFGFPIARTLGNCLAAGNLARLSELMGAGRVREMLFTARLMRSDEALEVGLVSEVLEDEDALLARAEALAEQVGAMAPLTLRATKEALRRNRAATQVDDADLIEMTYMSADFKEGMEAFLSKRAPNWTGK
ncbi:MAG: enoyl-CoA hydratase/isomerase family protein [Dinoroseobacter sp.]|nr:enoyl-CoA hydratase/isomerase family protein [Dinoroseobacter sp.]